MNSTSATAAGETPEAAASGASSPARPPVLRALSAWLGGTRLGLVVMALLVGVGAGLGAVAFRELIFAFTWLATGRRTFGQQGHAASLHLPFLGIFFVLVVPVVGGLLYGPLIQRFAREARGHGVPEVMLAVAENGGRIRPPVTIVKAIASAMCIGVGGSVGREGPIVQIGSALASTLGQLVRMSESRLRVIVACGAAGGISATFNAPLTGLFFGFELVLREFSLEALFATSLAAVTGDVISRAFFGSGPFFAAIPHDLFVTSDGAYLLVAALALLAGLIGVGFKTVLYRLEDLVDQLWAGRPEWARPAVGGLPLGLVLLALPQMYGVGYPVMDSVIAGHVVLGLVVLFILGKVLATSLTLAIGGSGGVFAPSLFIGAMAGEAFGVAVHHLFGPSVGPPALYAVVAMGGVFAAAAQAPLTAIASVVEMTGNFGITVAVMLACGVASALSKQLSHGSIYTTKLLRRGIDIERPRATTVLQRLRVADVMQPIAAPDGQPPALVASNGAGEARPGEPGPEQDHAGAPGSGEARPAPGGTERPWCSELGALITDTRQPQELFGDETLEQALRQLILYGRAGLPVLSEDRRHLKGWLTRHNVLSALAGSVEDTRQTAVEGAVASDYADGDPSQRAHAPSTPLRGYRIVELTITPDAPAAGRRLSEVPWPPGATVVAATEGHELIPVSWDMELRAGERVILMVPAAG